MTAATGNKIYGWATDLFPICRSLSGDGVRKTLSYIQKLLPELKVYSVPSGTKAFDWTVPDEWNIRDAYVMDQAGNRIIDFKQHNLHVVGYSEPVDAAMSFSELDKHLYSLPDQPEAIPYITSYYKRQWGFCLTDNQREELKKSPEATYKVKIDSTLEPGNLNYGELIIPGKEDKEILLSTYVCHPSMANNELSGPCVATALAQWIQGMKERQFTYRILFLVETIGSIAYLSKHLEEMQRSTIAGFVLTCIGDNGEYSYIPSRAGDTLADKVAKHVLSFQVESFREYSYLDRGSDERQYCSPGVDLPVCNIMRSKFNEYPEYHTSLDNLDFVTPQGLQGAFNVYQKAIELMEANKLYHCKVKCEPQLGKRGLYPSLSTKGTHQQVNTMMNVIAYADGKNSLLDIAIKIDTYMGELIPIAEQLLEAGVLEVFSESSVK
jgi:aminopeptidase-like protein